MNTAEKLLFQEIMRARINVEVERDVMRSLERLMSRQRGLIEKEERRVAELETMRDEMRTREASDDLQRQGV